MDERDRRIVTAPHSAPLSTDQKIDQLRSAMKQLGTDVLHVRMALDPIGIRVRIILIAGSAFMGGVLTVAILWLLGIPTLFNWHP